MVCLKWSMPLVFLWTSVGAFRSRHTRVTHKTSDSKSFHVKVMTQSGGGCEMVEASWGQMHRLAKNKVFESEPRLALEEEEAGDGPHSDSEFVDLWGPDEAMVRSRAAGICGGNISEVVQTDMMNSETEVRCIECSGEAANRIDVVLMGDGYTLKERGRFFEDMERLTRDMFTDVTFRSYLPLFNIWAIHVPSVESGIGYYGRSKNTPFGLYKNGEQHRAVLPTDSGRSKARSVCKLADGCDYPSLIGNDEFYGGLGGEFTIGTRSKTTGTVVLRHEMGHNFVGVGEEYDGGYVYSGVNSDKPTGWFNPKPKENIKWKHWLTEPDKAPVEQRMKLAFNKYPWQDMAVGPQTFTFKTDGSFSRWRITFSASGFPEYGSLKVTLDGKELEWKPTRQATGERGDGSTVDRQFYHFRDNSKGLGKGTHTLTFETGFAPPQGAPIRQLCSLSIYEYGSPEEFNYSPGYIGAYPSWDIRGRKSYRPTNEMCLMRDMESTVLCPVCKEGMWLQFFSRMEVIDSVDVDTSSGHTQVTVNAVPVAQFRKKPMPGVIEKLIVTWYKGGFIQSNLQDTFTFTGDTTSLSGNWKVKLEYQTSEVRKDPNGLLTAEKSFRI